MTTVIQTIKKEYVSSLMRSCSSKAKELSVVLVNEIFESVIEEYVLREKKRNDSTLDGTAKIVSYTRGCQYGRH